ncbi:hypothetical protein Dimus_034595 [Dionaea muscipula]
MLISGFNLADLFPSVKLLSRMSGMRRKVEKLIAIHDRIFENIMADHEIKMRRNSSRRIDQTQDEDEEPQDLLQILSKLQSTFPLDSRGIKAIMADVLFGGAEMVSTIIEWVMSELVKNPSVLAKAQAEVREQVYHHHKGIKRGTTVDNQRNLEVTSSCSSVAFERKHRAMPCLGIRDPGEDSSPD